MYSYLDIPGLRPLNEKETAAMEAYEKHMEEVVIPQIIAQDFENRQRVAELRHRILD